MVFEKNEDDIKNMFIREQNAIANYSNKIRNNEDTSSNYFEETENNKKTKTDIDSKLPKDGRSWLQKLFGK